MNGEALFSAYTLDSEKIVFDNTLRSEFGTILTTVIVEISD